MSAIHPTDVRNRMAAAVLELIDAGSGPGKLVFKAAGGAEVATLTFSDPAFLTPAVAGVATADLILPDEDSTGGTIATADFVDSDDNLVCTCSVTATNGGGDIELNSVVLSAGQEMNLTALTYTAAP